MILIIGGRYQGKRDYAMTHYAVTGDDVFTCDEAHLVELDHRVIEHIECYALGCVKRGESPSEFWLAHLAELEDKILIADDISCGVVPMSATLRAWREASGRANAMLAARSERVIRVFCGLGQVIK